MKNLMRGLSALFLLFLCFIQVQAQVQDPEAKAILDAVAKKYRAMDAYKTHFTQTIKSNTGDVYGQQEGNIIVSGTKFHITMDQMEIFCNSKTVWTYMKDVNEVQITKYEKDGQQVTLSTIYEIYKEGYKYILYGTKKINGKLTHIMDLEPTDHTEEIVKIRLWVEKSSREIVQWKLFMRGSNDRQLFEIKDFKANVPVNRDMFVFNKSKYPKAEVIDLR